MKPLDAVDMGLFCFANIIDWADGETYGLHFGVYFCHSNVKKRKKNYDDFSLYSGNP